MGCLFTQPVDEASEDPPGVTRVGREISRMLHFSLFFEGLELADSSG